ncbi:primary-amine oxidase [Rubrobacter indicoceani]|uniref:primary-amine oxidase n=1 Tax=Rubrobacter indicoceani TaxID=2051957 RepID=UPI000E5AD71A|nr:primary-amine oxidase [Rubrobacter indicoceani]
MTVSGHFYPLDPLSEAEIRVVVGVLKRDRRMDSRWRFASIELKEPDKERLKSHDAGEEIPREADLVVWNREDGQAYKARVSLTEGTVIGWEPRPGEQPNITVDEFHEADEMLRQHPDAIEALKKRGITDLNKVLFDVWAYGGSLVAERHRGRRVGWADVWVRDHEDSNPYANPVNGLHFVVDLNSVELLEVEDDYAVERPDVMGEYLPKYVPDQKLRDDLKPLEIAQPEGVSFTLEGNLLEWQKWSLRVGFNYREGLVLHTVGYRDERDGGRTRSIAHRMSFAEMIVPYRDPSPDHYRRTAFDIGEWGLGYMTSSLELGCDCLGEIRYLDAVLSDSKGEPYTIKNAVCIHEEDDALLWKHVDEVAGSEVRRSRRLVISFHATVANYEYIVYWRFYQDGNIECEVRATGIMVTTSFEGERPPYGTLVDRRTYAPHHQHFLVARLDLDVDGETNTVYMTESEATPVSDENPHGLGLVQKSTPLKTESEGRQDYNWNTQRAWKVVNDGKKNRLGTSVGYKLVPGACFPAMMDKSSPVFKRAGVVGHNLWVTPYSEDERWPCGEFVNQSEVDSGLTKWTERNRNIEEADVVLWYVFGIHHITRPEDWPVMPVDTVSFWMKPVGFFDRNPALDVPPASKGHCHSGDPS